MIFAGIDVNVITHEKALAAGIEAFGLWAWGMCYAQLHETDGRLPRVAVLSALAGKRNIMHAQRLVTSGLWTENEDGSWQIYNYRKKNQSSEEIRKKKEAAAERTRAWRERMRDASRTRNEARDEQIRMDPPPEPSPSPQPPPENKRGESAPPVGVKRALREDEPFTDKRVAYVDTLHMQEGVLLDGPKVWRAFVNDRISNGILFGSHEQVDAAWRKWAGKEVDFEKERREKDRKHKARMEKRYGDHTPKYEKPTGAQSKSIQQQLAERIAAEQHAAEAKKGAA